MTKCIEETGQESMSEEMNSKSELIAWIKAHKKQLALTGVGCTATLIFVVLGLKNKDELTALWASFLKGTKPTLAQSALPVQKYEANPPMLSEIVPRTYTHPSAPIDVRWHIRTLADGRHHSAAKRAEAEAMGIVIAPNQTIVDSYLKNIA